MTPEQSNTLTKALLGRLFEIEPTIEAGGSILVQPHIDGKQTTNSITVPGYDWSQIDSQLRTMCQRGLVSSGTVQYDSAAIGIYFSCLTPAGRKLLGR
jgi:hypothetical protein